MQTENQQIASEIDVVLPAGGRISGTFAQMVGTDIKALIALNGETLLARAIKTLRATGRVRRVVVVGPEAARTEALNCGADDVLEEGASGPDNILRGLKAVGGVLPEQAQAALGASYQTATSSRVLIATTDLPFLTPDALNKFLDAIPSEADVALPVVSAADFDARFPGSHAVYVRLGDGNFTLGGAFLVNPQTLLQNEAHLRAVFAARKSQFAMARLVGARTLWRFLTRSLTVPEIAARAGAILNCRGAAIMNAPSELAYDIDVLEEYTYAQEYVGQQAALTRPSISSASEVMR